MTVNSIRKFGCTLAIAFVTVFCACDGWGQSANATSAQPSDLVAPADVGVRIFEADSPSVVQIVAETAPDGFPSRFSGAAGVSTGSGFIWDASGHVVTNNHVIENAVRVVVRLPSGTTASAEITGVAPTYDLAVLKITSKSALPNPLPLGSSSALKVGQSVFAIGNPFGLDQTMTTGIVSALKRRLPTVGGREIAGAIQTDASINPGNSGGPLLDSQGRLIGVTSAILSPSGANAGIGFAIPVDLVNRVVPELIRTGHVGVPGIGVAVADESVAARIGVQEGLVVVSVAPGSPAQKAGLRGVNQSTGTLGDIIVAADGVPVATWSDLVDAFEKAGVGNRLSLTVVSNNARRELMVQVIDVSQGG